ncbi:IS3 family transposase [Streptomyces sp. NPDC059564]|uniref:IS3 family transposase n=1 Tax=Streptomyces sp. NPDC059564 TaxID=3346865 RepID=UPI00368D96CB
MTDEIMEIFKESGSIYGSPKIFILPVRKGWLVSVNTAARVMAEAGLVARLVKHRRGMTRLGKRQAAPDFVQRDFTAQEPGLVWVGDKEQPVGAASSVVGPWGGGFVAARRQRGPRREWWVRPGWPP